MHSHETIPISLFGVILFINFACTVSICRRYMTSVPKDESKECAVLYNTVKGKSSFEKFSRYTVYICLTLS